MSWWKRRKHRQSDHTIQAWQFWDTPGWTCSCGEEWIG